MHDPRPAPPAPPPLTPVRVFWFYLPLAAMWLTMGVEQPVITAFIGRLPDEELNLAAFGVAFTMGLLIEAPVIMLLTAGTALADSRANYARLLRFTHILAASLTALHALVGFTPLHRVVIGWFVGAQEELITPVRDAFVLMTPWTASIAYRRLWQGVLIRFRRTVVVPIAMIARLVAVCGVLILGFGTGVPGAVLGALSLSCGVIASAAATYAFCAPVLKRMPGSSTSEPIAWKELLHFYAPLALTSLLTLGRRPILTMGMARSLQALASLAVWPVVTSVLFIIGSLAIASQEVVVALRDEERSFDALQRFTRGLSLCLVGMLALFAFTPLARLWFAHVADLDAQLVALAGAPMMLLCVVPGLDTMLAWNRGLLVHERRTSTISWAVALNLAVLLGTLFGLIAVTELTGATVAAVSLAAALGLEAVFLWWRRTRAARRPPPARHE